MTKNELNKIFDNSLEMFYEKNFEWYATKGWDSGYIPYLTFVRIKDKFVLFFDYDPILTFNETFYKGMNYSEKEKRYVDNVYAYAVILENWIDNKLRVFGKTIQRDHHFSCSMWLNCLSDDIAKVLDDYLNIRPIINNYVIEKEEDGSYFCSCKMNGHYVDTHFENGSFKETTFEACMLEIDDAFFAEEGFEEENILRKHFHFAMFALDWKKKKELEKSTT